MEFDPEPTPEPLEDPGSKTQPAEGGREEAEDEPEEPDATRAKEDL